MSGGGRLCGGADRDKVVVAPLLVCRQLRRPTRDARPDVRTRALPINITVVAQCFLSNQWNNSKSTLRYGKR
jgi:hypothetical protein